MRIHSDTKLHGAGAGMAWEFVCSGRDGDPPCTHVGGHTAAEVNLAAALFTFVLTVVTLPSYLFYSLHQVKDRSPALPSRADSRWYIYDFTDALWFLREDRRVYLET